MEKQKCGDFVIMLPHQIETQEEMVYSLKYMCIEQMQGLSLYMRI